MITIRLDTSQFTAHAGAFVDQVPFATALALNRTADAAERAIRSGIAQRMTIRRPWVVQGITIKRQDRATKLIPQVTISVDPARAFLNKFEAGGTKAPLGGGLSLALPAGGVRPDLSVIVPHGKRPRAFHFTRRVTHTHSGYEIFGGDQRTFLIRAADGTGYIFQRRASGGRGRRRQDAPRRLLGIHGGDPHLVLLYVLEPEAKIPAELAFVSTGTRVVRERFQAIYAAAWAQATSTAR